MKGRLSDDNATTFRNVSVLHHQREREREVLGNLEGRGGISPDLLETGHSLLIDPSLGLESGREIHPCKNHIDSLQTEPTLIVVFTSSNHRLCPQTSVQCPDVPPFLLRILSGAWFPLAAIDEFKEASQRTR